jgi:hypothetical protein
MAGAGCLLGCENMTMATASSQIASPASVAAIVVSGEACASLHSHDCCAKRSAQSVSKAAPKAAPKSDKLNFVSRKNVLAETDLPPALGATPFPMSDCPLAVNATAALSKSGPDDSNVALPASSKTSSLSNPPEQVTSMAHPLRLPNRGHTYLHCCVFLI